MESLHTAREGAQPLCTVCTRIDFRRYTRTQMQPKRLGTWERIQTRNRCPFCSLVIRILNRVYGQLNATAKVALENKQSWKLCVAISDYEMRGREIYLDDYDFHADPDQTNEFSNKADLEDKANRDEEVTGYYAYRFLLRVSKDGNERYEKQSAMIQYIPNNDPAESVPHFFGREIQPRINRSLLKQWLDNCKEYHGHMCNATGSASTRIPGLLRVIDVTADCIVPMKKNTEYIALSYVWGIVSSDRYKTKKHLRRNDGTFLLNKEQLPRTIRNAMRLTQLLGFRYLWNDALCIIQDDELELESQVRKMDAIYNNATLTIVAAAGIDAEYGLPGLHHDRPGQPKQVVNGMQLAEVCPTLPSLIRDNSIAWNQRGWTFQERALSKRLLVFTDQQVYFRCSNAVWCEDTVMEAGKTSIRNKRCSNPYQWPMDRTSRKVLRIMKQLYELAMEHPTVNRRVLETFDGITKSRTPLTLWNDFALAMELQSDTMEKLQHLDLKSSSIQNFLLSNAHNVGDWTAADDDAARRVGSHSTYVSMVQAYTQRHLTNREDVLRALSGLLRTFEDEMGSFTAGMPVRTIHPLLLWYPQPGSTCTLSEVNVPSWSWARWGLSHGCRWRRNDWPLLSRSFFPNHLLGFEDEDPGLDTETENMGFSGSDAPSFAMWLYTLDEQIPVHVNLRVDQMVFERLPSETYHPPPLEDGNRRRLTELGSLLLLDTARVQVRIGERLLPRSAPLPGQMDETALFSLVDGEGDAVGEIWTTPRVAAQGGPQDFITLSWGAMFDEVEIAPRYSPSLSWDAILDRMECIAPEYIPAIYHGYLASSATAGGGSSGAKARLSRYMMRKVSQVMLADAPKIAHVMLVERDGGLWRRVALGKMAILAWLEARPAREWVVLG